MKISPTEKINKRELEYKAVRELFPSYCDYDVDAILKYLDGFGASILDSDIVHAKIVCTPEEEKDEIQPILADTEDGVMEYTPILVITERPAPDAEDKSIIKTIIAKASHLEE